ncbi:eukaryotic aspartyl protease family protein isoform X2 [Tasmannia lanceolata]|uniref:eukaryotic aspartyl protease family protein isoform X2 n=1 Tax=Tasmannia lanceolata TaxID=3420 RepID=UPI004062CF99
MEERQIKGVVIISLPPPDDPAQGKTITAFTLSDPPIHHHHHHHQQQQQQRNLLPVQANAGPPISSSFSCKRLLFRTTFGLLGALLFTFVLYIFPFPDSPFELHRPSEEEQRQVNSIVFTLYPKSGFLKDAELKLGTSVRRDEAAINGLSKRKNSEWGSSSSSSSFNSSTIFPVKGNVYPDGLYFVSIVVGNPPRPYHLDMDSGSDLTWIQCDAPCTSCAKGPHPLYRPTKGKLVTARDSLCLELQRNQNQGYCDSCQCDYEIEYADNSSSMGVLVRDEVQLMIANGTLLTSKFVFGCAYDQQGQLLVSPAKTDGILGLSRSAISLPSQLASRGIVKNVVGHCITSDVNGGGYMFFGDDFIPRQGMTWVPMPNNPSTNYYSTEINKLSFGGQQLSIGRLGNNAGKVIFDSGSSYTYLTKEAYNSLITSLKDISPEALIQDESDLTLPVCWRANFAISSAGLLKK